MEVELHCNGRADGSCTIRQGNSMYLAAVHGPRLCPSRKRDYEKLSIEYAFCHKVKSQHNRKIEFLMRTVLDHAVDKGLFPRNQLLCNVQELERDRDNTASSVNAVCLALLDAAVPLKHMFCGVYVSVETQSTDTEDDQQKAPSCSFIFVFKPSETSTGDLVGTVNNGKFTMDQFEQALNRAKGCCLSIFDFYREAMDKTFTAKLSYGLSAKRLRKFEAMQH
ncbi:hypothetical protein QR680_000885 [Steinernema hermaphroditum]|uniref:Exoribonuclease phosphorolytic domain-containing protein n=1 Tax=Steinernema hermaphroditum TaxID=289476 RepID=A0AA39GY76_9BILA|nr:hypothetical protein QR680_000885 [Steinernema hermaphroditum]